MSPSNKRLRLVLKTFFDHFAYPRIGYEWKVKDRRFFSRKYKTYLYDGQNYLIDYQAYTYE